MIMKANLFICTTALLLTLASCSEIDEPQSDTTGGHAISFSATAPKNARAATTTATLNSFMVYAFTGTKPLMEGVEVKRDGGSWTYSPAAYWPDAPVNFFAFSPDISSSTQITGSGTNCIPGFYNYGDIDLLYAVNMNEYAKPTPVAINFRHAMSQISVKLSSTNSTIQVRLYHVKLCNLFMKGTFDFPTATTSPDTPEVTGTWSEYADKGDLLTYYNMEGYTILTRTPTDYTESNLNLSFFLPQQLEQVALENGNFTGSYIEVDCEIYDTSSGAKLWPKADTPPYLLVSQSPAGRLIFPVRTTNVTEWKIGYSYVYNIAINNPSVLDAIGFAPTVDEYNEFTEINP